MEKQDVSYNQSGWEKEKEKPKTPKVDARGVFGAILGFLGTALFFLIATPFFIVIWTINFLKSLFGMFIMWVVGKGCLTLFVYMLSYLLHKIKLIDYDTVERWSSIVGRFLFAADGDIDQRLFPHGAVEYWAIVILALIIATFSTIYRDEL